MNILQAYIKKYNKIIILILGFGMAPEIGLVLMRLAWAKKRSFLFAALTSCAILSP